MKNKIFNKHFFKAAIYYGLFVATFMEIIYYYLDEEPFWDWRRFIILGLLVGVSNGFLDNYTRRKLEKEDRARKERYGKTKEHAS